MPAERRRHLTLRSLRSLRSLRPGGRVRDTTVVEASVERAVVEDGGRVVLPPGPARFPGAGTAKVRGPEGLDVVVTDTPGDPATRSSFPEADVEAAVAGKVRA